VFGGDSWRCLHVGQTVVAVRRGNQFSMPSRGCPVLGGVGGAGDTPEPPPSAELPPLRQQPAAPRALGPSSQSRQLRSRLLPASPAWPESPLQPPPPSACPVGGWGGLKAAAVRARGTSSPCRALTLRHGMLSSALQSAAEQEAASARSTTPSRRVQQAQDECSCRCCSQGAEIHSLTDSGVAPEPKGTTNKVVQLPNKHASCILPRYATAGVLLAVCAQAAGVGPWWVLQGCAKVMQGASGGALGDLGGMPLPTNRLRGGLADVMQATVLECHPLSTMHAGSQCHPRASSKRGAHVPHAAHLPCCMHTVKTLEFGHPIVMAYSTASSRTCQYLQPNKSPMN
jgi:hypothetical protein